MKYTKAQRRYGRQGETQYEEKTMVINCPDCGSSVTMPQGHRVLPIHTIGNYPFICDMAGAKFTLTNGTIVWLGIEDYEDQTVSG